MAPVNLVKVLSVNSEDSVRTTYSCTSLRSSWLFSALPNTIVGIFDQHFHTPLMHAGNQLRMVNRKGCTSVINLL